MVWLPVEVDPNPVTLEIDGNETEPLTISPFFITKYLVTAVQFDAFCQAEDGFNTREWWLDFPQADPRRHKLIEQRTKAPNSPRDSVSWYQSVAFGRWINHRLQGVELMYPSGVRLCIGANAEVRLPLETEWQWAAQGGARAKQYPWEDGKWKAGYANTIEAGLGRAVAVGMYPHGAAECGALDVAGNLFEWCLNDYDNPEIIDGYGNGERKVLRGGTFFHNQVDARAAVRNYGFPNHDGYGRFGLRLVVAASIASQLSESK